MTYLNKTNRKTALAFVVTGKIDNKECIKPHRKPYLLGFSNLCAMEEALDNKEYNYKDIKSNTY